MKLTTYAALTKRIERTDAEAASKEAMPYRQLTWMLIYLSTHILSEIKFATAILWKYMAVQRPVHCNLCKCVGYLRRTSEFSIHLYH